MTIPCPLREFFLADQGFHIQAKVTTYLYNASIWRASPKMQKAMESRAARPALYRITHNAIA